MKSLQQIVSDERRATAPERRVAKADPEKLRAGAEKLAAACIRALAELKAHGLAPGNRDQLGIARALIEADVEVEQTPDPILGAVVAPYPHDYARQGEIDSQRVR